MDAKVTPLGTLIDQMQVIRAKRQVLAQQDKELMADYTAKEEEVIARLTATEMEGGKGKKASCSLGTEVVANIVDFDALCKYVKKTGYFHLFQRRVSNPAFRELAAKKPVPGLEAFTKIKLNLTTLKEKV